MKKRFIFITAILALGAAAILAPVFSPSPLDILTNWGLVATILVGLSVAAFFYEFESSAISSKEIALVGMLSTLSAVARIPFAAIPSVQPCTFLIICSGYVFGPMVGFMVGAVTALVSNLFLGQGVWTLFQMLAWGLAGITAGGLRRFTPGLKWLVAFSIAWGYLFGAIMNVWFWSSFIYPLTLKTFMVYQLSSVWFDTMHAIGNAVLMGFFGKKTMAILDRFRERFQWGVISPRPPGSKDATALS